MDISKIQLTDKGAVLESLELWIWLFKNPGERKIKSPYWEDIKDMLAHCPMCEMYLDDGCVECCIERSTCYNQEKAFPKWLVYPFEKKYSAHIAWTLRKYAQEKGWLFGVDNYTDDI